MNRISSLARFFGRFLYGTSRRYFAAAVLAAAVYAGIGFWFIASHAIASPQLVIALIGLIAIAAFLYYGARQASMTRLVDAQTLRTQAERELVHTLQTALLQRALPIVPNVSINATYLPANVGELIGGDWYDVLEVAPQRIMFSVGDVVGHGIQAAVMMNLARQAIVTAALRERDPGDILARANGMLRPGDTQFITATCGFVDTTTLEVEYSCAGHPPAMFVRKDGPVELLECRGLPLGVSAEAQYETYRFHACDDSLLILYTDGLIEYDRDLLTGLRRLEQVARHVALEAFDNPAEAIQDTIFSEYAPTDDVAILTILFRKVGPVQRTPQLSPTRRIKGPSTGA